MYTDDLDRRRRRCGVLAWLALCAVLGLTAWCTPPDHTQISAADVRASAPDRTPTAADRNSPALHPTFVGVLDRQLVPAGDGRGAAALSQAAAPLDVASPTPAAADASRSQPAGGEDRQGAPQQDLDGVVFPTVPPVAPAGPLLHDGAQPAEHPIDAGGAYGDPDGPAGATPSADAAGITLPPEADAIRQCESGGDYRAENPDSSASGAWQFIASTWEWVTGLAPPASAYPPAVQDRAFVALWADGAGAAHWNASRHCWEGS